MHGTSLDNDKRGFNVRANSWLPLSRGLPTKSGGGEFLTKSYFAFAMDRRGNEAARAHSAFLLLAFLSACFAKEKRLKSLGI